MNVSQCCNCPHSAAPRGRCLCLCHRGIEAQRCQPCGYVRAQCHCPSNAIATFAASLNPAAGALAESLPFALTAPVGPDTTAHVQPDLFTEKKA